MYSSSIRFRVRTNDHVLLSPNPFLHPSLESSISHLWPIIISQATPRSQFSNFDHSHRSTFVSSKGIISNSTVYIHIIVPKPSNTYRTRSDTLRTRRFETLSFHDPWTIPIHSPFDGTMIHPSLSKGKQKSPLFSITLVCSPVSYIPDSPCQAN